MTYQMISLDMDGTLLDSTFHISKANLEAICQAQSLRKTVIVATGRSLSEMNPYMAQLQHVRYFVLESGAVIYDQQNKEIIKQSFFDYDDVEKIIAIARQQDCMPHYFTGGYSYSFLDKMKKMDRYQMGKLQQFYLENVYRIDDFKKFMLCYGHQIEKIILYHQSMDDVKKCYELLKNVHVEKPTVGVSVEISPLGINKASAVKWLCQYLNISSDEIIAVGDSDNDLEIMEMAGLAIAVANANDNIKRICDTVVSDHDHDGVIQAINAYLLFQ